MIMLLQRWNTTLRYLIFSVVLSCTILLSAFASNNSKEVNIASMVSPKHLGLADNSAITAPEILYQNVYESLVRYNSSNKIVTGLARAWSHNADFTEWTFELQREVTFHDGVEFSSDDVVFTFRNLQVRDLGTWNKLFSDIIFVKKDGPWRVVFLLKRPMRDFLKYLARPEAVIVNSATWFSNEIKPNGTGPFIYSLFQRDERLELLKNHSYWDHSRQIDKIVYHFNLSVHEIATKINKGKLDGVIGLQDMSILSQFSPNFFDINSNPGGGILTVFMNQKNGAMANYNVRNIIAHAINRQELIDVGMAGHATPAYTTVKAYDEVSYAKPFYEYSKERARALMARTGYNQGLSVRISVQDIPSMRLFASLIKNQLKKIGVMAEIIPVPVNKWNTHIYKNKDFEIALMNIEGELNILDYASPNFFNYSSTVMNRLVEQVIYTDNATSKIESMEKIRHIIAQDALVIPLIKMDYISVFKRGIMVPKHSTYRPEILFNDTYIE